MKQMKQIFGLPMTISHNARTSSLTRSAGTNRRVSKSSGETLAGTRNRENSPGPRLCDKSYARLIADYSRAIEARSGETKCSGDPMTRGVTASLFLPKSFERLARISSMVKIKNGGTNTSSNLSTNSSPGPPVASSNKKDCFSKIQVSLDETEVLEQVTTRADWLDHVVRAHTAKRALENNPPPNHCEKEKKSSSDSSPEGAKNLNAKEVVQESSKVGNHPITVGKKIGKKSRVETKKGSPIKYSKKTSNFKKEYSNGNSGNNNADASNVSVTVKALEKSDVRKNKFVPPNYGNNVTFVVTVTEESNLPSTSDYSPLRHIDLRINGEPATGMDAVIRKVEKLDVVSLADKIEIKIPVLSETTGSVDDEPRVSSSIINLCISNHADSPNAFNDTGSYGKIGQAGDSGSGNSRPSSPNPSTFYASKMENVGKLETSRSKAIPWWTTEESFRQSENISVRPSESAITMKEAKTYGVAKVAARGNNQKAHERDAKEIAISDAGMRIKTVVTKPSSLRQRSETNGKATTAAPSRIIENNRRKKSEDRQENAQHRVLCGVTKPVAKSDSKVKNTVPNELKKETPSAIIDVPIRETKARTIGPTFHKVSKQMPATSSPPENLKAPGIMSMPEPGTRIRNDKRTEDNSSDTNNSKESIQPKPITAISKDNNDNKNASKGEATNKTQLPRASDPVRSRKESEPRREISSKSEVKATPQLPRTYGSVKLLPTTQSVSDPGSPSNNQHRRSIKQNNETTSETDGKLKDAKNSSIPIKPIEKRKDGTLIDYGLTVSTRKKLERKLPDSQSSMGVEAEKIARKKEPVVTATIEEVIPKKIDKDFRGTSINGGIVQPARLNKHGPANRSRLTGRTDRMKYDVCKSKIASSKEKNYFYNKPKKSKTPIKLDKKSIDLSKSNRTDSRSEEKKLLYSAWLRRCKEKDDQDPDSSKDPRES